MEDIAYLNINSTSTDEQKINAVIDFLSKSNAGYSLLYDKLFIPVGKEILFNEKLKATGLVTTSHGHTQDRPFFHLNEEGRIMIAEYNNFINYHKIKTIQTQKELNAIQEKENL
jgi:predicted xylose isomerase-like sugar epimerase